MRKNSNKGGAMLPSFASINTNESEEEIRLRLDELFTIMDIITIETINGNIRSTIVSGPPGVGKSYSIEQNLKEFDPTETLYSHVKGTVRATGLYKMLYKHRKKNNIIVFDDADSLFFDDITLNLLKAVCDTTGVRRVSWLSELKMTDDNTGENIPSSFDFEGSIIFITNLDFDDLIARGHSLAPHLAAFISRSHYIDLKIKTERDCIVRIKMVMESGMLSELGDAGKNDVLTYIEENVGRLRELSLRAAIKLGQLRIDHPESWQAFANVTCLKNQ